MDNNNLLTVKQAMIRLNIKSRLTIYKMIKQGKLQACKPCVSFRITEQSLNDLINRGME